MLWLWDGPQKELVVAAHEAHAAHVHAADLAQQLRAARLVLVPGLRQHKTERESLSEELLRTEHAARRHTRPRVLGNTRPAG